MIRTLVQLCNDMVRDIAPTLLIYTSIFIPFIKDFNVSGGPFGAEEIISGVGPLFGIIGIAIFPFIWVRWFRPHAR